MRAAIYARYSSDQQRAASIEDQVEVCRRYVERQGWSVAQVYADRALSGASAARPGFQALLADAERGRFEVVVVEALDRVGRRLADVAALHDRLEFRRVQLHAVNMGLVGAMHVGLLGTMAQLYHSDLKDKTRRGQLGRVLQGRAAGGRAYGYRTVEGETGVRRIDEAEAAVVRRIFRLFGDGVSPRAIAKTLNAEGVPGPDGRPWQDTTIRGQAERGTGILNNELYTGQLVWNRCSYVKDPRSGRRLARPNPPAQWERQAVPELRIIADDLWEPAKRRQQSLAFVVARDEAGQALNRTHRRRFLLSGLLACGVCGAGYTIMAKDRYGCAGHRSKGTCGNDRTIARAAIEGRVLEGLKRHLLAPERFEQFAREWQEAYAARTREADAARAGLQARLGQVERKIAAMIRAIEEGLYQPSMKARMTALEAEKAQLQAELASTPDAAPVALHPNLPAIYRRKVEELEAVLADPELGPEAMAAIRSMIGRIVLTPGENGGVEAVLEGDLARILAVCAGAERTNARLAGGRSADVLSSQVSVVAGARLGLRRTIRRATKRPERALQGDTPFPGVGLNRTRLAR
jgi:DNA invertase Pin-like site-specific DNA recombinase